MVKYSNIPEHLKENAIWCCWKYKTVNGRKTKIPVNPITNKFAKVNNNSDFIPFNEVVKYADKYDGLGIKVSNNLVAIDIDDCVVNSKFTKLAKEIINKFKGSYIEYSPSGKGLRLFLIVSNTGSYNLNDYKMKTKDLEVYVSGFTNRFVTVTGDVYQEGSLLKNNDLFMWILDTYMKKEQVENKVQLQTKSYLSDEEVIIKASSSKNSDKFNALWNGDISCYGSHSEADLGLASILAFYAGGNPEQTDRLFRKSALYRNKWDEKRGSNTYGDITINRAITSQTSFYSPIRTTSAAEDFNDCLQKLFDLGFPHDQNKYPWTDIGASKLFADYYKSILRFVPERKSWFIYENGIWKKDTANLKAMSMAMKLADLIHISAIQIKEEVKRNMLIKFSNKWQNHSYRNNLLKDAQVHYPISINNFDKDPYVLNLKNGTYNLKTNKFSAHNSQDFLTKMSPVDFDITATSDRWNSFISEITCGDEEVAKFIQKIFGYGLSGSTKHECMTILYGATTRNGKGTLCESVLKVLGTYGCTARPETIALNQNNNSSSPSEDIARLAGVRFVNIAEPKKGLILNAAQVKSMTGNDTLNARFLHENSFDFKPQFKIYINTNHLPVINDISIFTSGRLHIIPFNRHFDKNEQDKNLKTTFANEKNQSAILNWLIEGFNLLEKEGLKPPKAIQEATNKYEHESDKMSLFIEECLEKGNYEVKTADVYPEYRRWCTVNGHFAESMRTFKQTLSAKVDIRKKRPESGGNPTTIITGYRIKSEFLEL